MAEDVEEKTEDTPPDERTTATLDERVTNVEQSLAELLVIVAELNGKVDAAMQQKEPEHGTDGAGHSDDTAPDDGRPAQETTQEADTPPRPQHRWYRKPGE